MNTNFDKLMAALKIARHPTCETIEKELMKNMIREANLDPIHEKALELIVDSAKNEEQMFKGINNYIKANNLN